MVPRYKEYGENSMTLEDLGLTQEEWDGPQMPKMVDGRYDLAGVYELTSEQYAKVKKWNELHKQSKGYSCGSK